MRINQKSHPIIARALKQKRTDQVLSDLRRDVFQDSSDGNVSSNQSDSVRSRLE